MTDAETDCLGDLDRSYHLHPMTNPVLHTRKGPLMFVRGEGPYVFDETGRKYLDALSGLWCASLGYSEARVTEAIKRQLDTLPFFHTFWGRANEPATRLAARLIELAPVPMAQVLFQNSGSEANDAAVKLAWYAHNARGKTKKRKVISRWNGYHGTSISAVSMSGFPFMHMHFNEPLDFSIHLTCPDYFREAQDGESEADFVARLADELERKIAEDGADTIAAMIAEPVMGSGGVILPPKGYFEAIQPILKRNDILLIADEVITGFGRTGHLWGSSYVGMKPDMITCSKGLTASYVPMSAVLISREIVDAVNEQSDTIGLFAHGYTTSGHPVCAAAALAAIEIYTQDRLADRCAELGEQMLVRMRSRLGAHPHVANIRGAGLMLGLSILRDRESKTPFPAEWNVAAWISDRVLQQDVILRSGRDTVVMSPPFITNDQEADRIVDALATALDDFDAHYTSGAFDKGERSEGGTGVQA